MSASLRCFLSRYVLDPEGNLPSTRDALAPLFRRLEDRTRSDGGGEGRRDGVGAGGRQGGEDVKWEWNGFVAEVPAHRVYSAALQDAELFVYCGHGSGERYLSRERIARLPRCAMSLLMGCSSGRLRGGGNFEPDGVTIRYLAAGSQAVVANLWDVTDKDIDRFSEALVCGLVEDGGGGREGGGEGGGEGDTSSSPYTLLQTAVAKSRTACKFPYLVGASTVVYGLPSVCLSIGPIGPS